MAQLSEQPGLSGSQAEQPYRLRVNDIIRLHGRLARVIRVNESAAVVQMERPPREFTTRFDQRVRFRPAPATFRISANSEVEIVSRKQPAKRKRIPVTTGKEAA